MGLGVVLGLGVEVGWVRQGLIEVIRSLLEILMLIVVRSLLLRLFEMLKELTTVLFEKPTTTLR